MIWYNTYMISRLNKSRDNPAQFLLPGEQLMCRSTSWLVHLLQGSFEGWYKNKSYGEVWSLLQSYRELNLSRYESRAKANPRPMERNVIWESPRKPGVYIYMVYNNYFKSYYSTTPREINTVT